MAKSKRRLILVDRRVKWAIVWQSVLHWVAHTLVAAIYLTLLELLLGGLKPWSEHWRTIWPLVASLLLSLLLLLPKFIYDSLQLSNRFVGPVSRLRCVLRELAEGKPLKPVTFRKDDYWQEMAGELNRAVEALTKQRSAAETATTDDDENHCSQVMETVAG
jgi:hypothetical protein